MKLKLFTLRYRHSSEVVSLLLAVFFLFPVFVQAQTFSVSPLIVDVDAEARDTFTRTVTLTNTGSRPLRLYASVHEIEVGDEDEILSFVPPSMSDRTTSITSWIEIKRSRLEIPVGESLDVPLTIRLNPNTKPALYHGYIGFAAGPNRDEVEADIMAGKGEGIVVRVSVGTNAKESLRLVSFTTDRFSYQSGKGVMNYELENTGDIPVALQGDVVIYDGRGRELTSINLADGNEGMVLAPGARQVFTKELPFIDRIGKNKAYLSVMYGEGQTATLNDTNFYYSVPWPYLLGMFLLLFLALTSIIFLVRRATRSSESQHEEVKDLPMTIRNRNEHDTYDHDINLKKTE